jgi:hypothetical protein
LNLVSSFMKSVLRAIQSGGGGLFDANVNLSALEFHLAILEGKESVVATDADIEAGLVARSALSDDNRPGRHDLPAIGFDAEILGITVAAVLGGPLSLFMCHSSPAKPKFTPSRMEGEGKFTGSEWERQG